MDASTRHGHCSVQSSAKGTAGFLPIKGRAEGSSNSVACQREGNSLPAAGGSLVVVAVLEHTANVTRTVVRVEVLGVHSARMLTVFAEHVEPLPECQWTTSPGVRQNLAMGLESGLTSQRNVESQALIRLVDGAGQVPGDVTSDSDEILEKWHGQQNVLPLSTWFGTAYKVVGLDG